MSFGLLFYTENMLKGKRCLKGPGVGRLGEGCTMKGSKESGVGGESRGQGLPTWRAGRRATVSRRQRRQASFLRAGGHFSSLVPPASDCVSRPRHHPVLPSPTGPAALARAHCFHIGLLEMVLRQSSRALALYPELQPRREQVMLELRAPLLLENHSWLLPLDLLILSCYLPPP